jgi:hypothetical protein
MATKKQEVAEATGGEVAIPQDWQAALAAEAKATASNVRPASSTISLRSGIVSYQGTQAPDNKLDVVIIDFAQEHTLYKTKYDPDNVSSPDCYAVASAGVELKDMTPGDNVANPESTNCGDCPMLKWGSSLNGGRGKACQQRFRLIAIPAGALSSADEILSAEAAIVKLPVTSGKVWSQYISTVASLHKRPEWAVVTTLSAKPDPKTQFKATFEVNSLIDFDATPELYKALMDKKGMVQSTLLAGYDTAGEAEPTNENAKY